MKALVTRPRADAAPLAAALAARGIEPVIEPLLEIRIAPDADQVLTPLMDDAQAVLFTSRNGVRAFAAASTRRDVKALAVGDATASAARAAGFHDIASAGGAAADLAGLAQRLLRPAGGALVHATGAAAADTLARALAAAGFTCHRAILYDAVPAATLSRDTVSLIAAGAIALALFFSPRTAASFARLARAAALGERCRTMTAIALSPAVTAAFDDLAWKNVTCAAVPTMAALLGALDRALAQRPTGDRQDEP